MSRIRSEANLSQVINFDSLSYGKISPTDIDAILEIDNQAYVIIEAKYEDASREAVWPRGQMITLERLTQDLRAAGKKVLTIRATHNQTVPRQVHLGNCDVQAYRKFKPAGLAWVFPTEPITVRELVDQHLERWGFNIETLGQRRRRSKPRRRPSKRYFRD